MEILLVSKQTNQSVCYYPKKLAGFHGSRHFFRCSFKKAN